MTQGKWNYFKLLNLSKEPFSNSPDPEFFFHSQQHVGCLQKLELGIRLRRGLNVVTGDVGTGKTTLCRQLIRSLANDSKIETHLILDPQFDTPQAFLSTIADMFGLSNPSRTSSEWHIKESIQKYLFQSGVYDQKTVLLAIDEGQKIPEFGLEILRELLNYEVNEYKLLQIVIFAQREFEEVLPKFPNFADRINLFFTLGPMSFRETRSMVRFRLHQARDGYKAPMLFTNAGLWAVYSSTGGYPRKIVHLCHRVLLALIIQNRTKAGWMLVRWCSSMAFSKPSGQKSKRAMALAAAGILLIVLVILLSAGQVGIFRSRTGGGANVKATSNTDSSTSEARDQASALVEQKTAFAVEKKAPTMPEPDSSPSPPDRQASSGGGSPLQGAPSAPPPPADEAAPVPGGAPEQPRMISVSSDSPSESGTLTEPSTPPVMASVKAPETAPPEILLSSPSSPAPAPEDATEGIPLILGQLTLKKQETLENIIRRVYGTSNAQYVKSVRESNPHIHEAVRLKAGRVIVFPAIPWKSEPSSANERWWVQVAEMNNLDEACGYLRKHSRDEIEIRIMPYWNSKLGLKFAIVVSDPFPDKDSAELVLSGLALKPKAKAKVLDRQVKGTVYFSR